MEYMLEYNEGKRAYTKGLSLSHCPYKGADDDERWDAWAEGFFDAQDEDSED